MVDQAAVAATPAVQNLIKIDDGVVIDEDSGEILEYPDGWQGDLLDHIMRAGLYAKDQARDWDRSHRVYRLAAGKIMEQRGIERWDSAVVGTASVRRQHRRRATVETLGKLLSRHRLPKTLANRIIRDCAATLDANRIEALAAQLDRAGRTKAARILREELIETDVSRFVQLDHPRKASNIVRFQKPVEDTEQ